MNQYCCEKCFSEYEIMSFIRANGQLGACNYCHSHQVQIRSLKGVGCFIRDGFHRAYEHVSEGTGKIYTGAVGEEAGESVFYILY